jgi:hypothetical protein
MKTIELNNTELLFIKMLLLSVLKLNSIASKPEDDKKMKIVNDLVKKFEID